jgi:hypothetical protein
MPAVGTFQDPADIELLKRYEPIVRYNHAELFFPTAVEGYLARCDLLMGRTERDQSVVVPVGEVSSDVIGKFVAEPGKSLYLRLVQKPFNGIELARWQVTGNRPRFHAPGCAARCPAALPRRPRSSTPLPARQIRATSTTDA